MKDSVKSMMENIKSINNPLTIIALFAGLAEIAMTVAIKLVLPELQYIFIWFVMGVTVLIILLFFLTLNFNAKVLYAPSDYKDEQNFVTMLGVERISLDLKGVSQQLETAKKQILDDVIKEVGAAGEKERESLKEIVSQKLTTVQSTVAKSIGIADYINVSQPARRIPMLLRRQAAKVLYPYQNKMLLTAELHRVLQNAGLSSFDIDRVVRDFIINDYIGIHDNDMVFVANGLEKIDDGEKK